MSIDCMQMLRDFHIQGQQPQEMTTPDERMLLVFGDTAWPKNAKTNYKIFSANSSNPPDYYTLESMWFLLANVTKPHSAYVRAASGINIPAIRRPDRMQLLDYLRGKSQEHEIASIDVDAYIEPAIRITGGDDDDDTTVLTTALGRSPDYQKLADLTEPILDGPKISSLIDPTLEPNLSQSHSQSSIDQDLSGEILAPAYDSIETEEFDMNYATSGGPSDMVIDEHDVPSTIAYSNTEIGDESIAPTAVMAASVIAEPPDSVISSMVTSLAHLTTNQMSQIDKIGQVNQETGTRYDETTYLPEDDYGIHETPHTPHTPHTPAIGEDTDVNGYDANNEFGPADPFGAGGGLSPFANSAISHDVSYVEPSFPKRRKLDDSQASGVFKSDASEFLKAAKREKELKKEEKKREKEAKKREKEKEKEKRRQREREKEGRLLAESMASYTATNTTKIDQTDKMDKIKAMKAKILTRDTRKGGSKKNIETTTYQTSNTDRRRQEEWLMDVDPAGDMDMDDGMAGEYNVDNVLTLISERERSWQTRHSVLQVPTRSFKDVLQILDNVNKEKKKDQNKASNIDKQVRSYNPSAPVQRIEKYSRYEQEKFNTKRNVTDGFKIDTKPFKNFKNPLETPNHVPRALSTYETPNLTPATPDSQLTNSTIIRQKKESRKKKTPIIIIPAASTSLITAFNAKSLLEKFLYVENKMARQTADAAERAGDLLISKRKVLPTGEEQQVHYRVISNVNKLEPRDWERVVCVFVQGPKWQFKGWPWLGGDSDGEITDIFQRTCAFHVRMAHLPIDDNIRKWSIQCIDLDNHARHQDGAKMRKMWAALESWIMKNKPDLRY